MQGILAAASNQESEVQPSIPQVNNDPILDKPQGFDDNLWNYLNEEEAMPSAEFEDEEITGMVDEIEASPVYQQEIAQKESEEPKTEEKDMEVSDILKKNIEDPVSEITDEEQKKEGIWDQVKKSLLTKEGVTQTVKDMPKTLVKGAVDTIGAVSDFLKFVSPFDPIDNVFERISKNADLKSEELGKEMNVVNEALSSVIIPYGAAYGAAVKLAPSAFKIGKFGIKNYLKFTGKQALVGGAVSFVLDDPKQDNLVKMLQDSDTVLGRMLPKALANNENDSEFESRMKNAFVGAGTDAAISAMIEPMVHLYRFIRQSKKIAQSPEGKVMKEIKEIPYQKKSALPYEETIPIKSDIEDIQLKKELPKVPEGATVNEDGIFYAARPEIDTDKLLPPAKGGEPRVFTTKDMVKEEATRKVWKTFEKETFNEKAKLLKFYYETKGLLPELGIKGKDVQKVELKANKIANDLRKGVDKKLIKTMEQDKLFRLSDKDDVLNISNKRLIKDQNKLNISKPLKVHDLFSTLYNIDSPFYVMPQMQEDENGKLRLQLGVMLRPAYMGDFDFFKFSRVLKGSVRKRGGRLKFNDLKSLNKVILKESRSDLAISGKSTTPSRPQKQATLIQPIEKVPITREFRKMTRDFGIFKGKEKRLTEIFVKEAPNFNVGRKDFNMTEFASVTKEAVISNGAIVNSPELAVINYLKHIQPVKKQIYPKQLPSPNQTLINKSNIETGIDKNVGVTKQIGQYRESSIDDFVSDNMNMYTSTIDDLANTYRGNKRLRQAGVFWPRKGVLGGVNKPDLPPAETEQIIALFEQAKTNVLSLVSDDVAFRKATSAQGVDLQNLKPENKEALFILGELKKQHKPGELVNIFAKHGVGLDEGLRVNVDPKTGQKSLTLTETLKSLPERTMDLIVENLVSQVATSVVVAKAGILHTAGDIMLRAFMRDLQNVVKYGKGSLTGDGWQKLSAKSELGEFKRTFSYYMDSILPAFSDMGSVLSGRADASTLAYNLGDRTSVLDAFKGVGNMQKLLKKYRQSRLYNVSKERGAMQGFALAEAPEFILTGLNSAWGIGKLQSLDAFFKRLWGPAQIEKYARLEAMQEIGERVAGMPVGKRKLPTSAEIAGEVQDRILIAQDRFKTGLQDDAVDMALDELNRGLFRSNNAAVAGTKKWNVGGASRSITNTLKELPGVLGPFGRMAGIFSEVVLNSSDYFVQRVPGLNFINPTIRAEWDSFARPEVIAKSLAGTSIGLTGWLLYMKTNGIMDITDSFDDRRKYKEVNGFFPNGDVIVQAPVIGKKYVITPLLPVGEQIAYGAVMAHYYDKFTKDSDFTSYLNSVVGKTAEKVLPVDLFIQFSEFFEFFKEMKESEEKGLKGIGKATQKLLDTGFLKEIKDFRRGFKTRQDTKSGVIASDLSSIQENSPFFDVTRLKESHLPITDWDRSDVPDFDWRGREITTRKDTGTSSIDDYFVYISRLKGFENDKISNILWDIQQDSGTDSLRLNPTDSFNMKDMYLSQMLSTLDKDKEEFIELKNVLDSPEYKSDTEWRLNNQQHRLLKKLAAGKSITVPIMQKGKEVNVTVDFKSELLKMSGQGVGEDFRSNEYAMLRKHQEAYKVLSVYGADKEKAVEKVIGDKQWNKMRSKVFQINQLKPPVNWIELRENIQKGMEVGEFKNAMEGNPSFETPEGKFMFNRLVDEFETGQFEGSGKRKVQAKKNMRIAINDVVTPYNKLAKTIFLFKVLGKSDTFLQKIFNPEKQKASEKFKSGEYDYSRFSK